MYSNGKANGESKVYYDNEKVYSVCTYIDDMKNGDFKTYHSNGELWEISSFINDKEIVCK